MRGPFGAPVLLALGGVAWAGVHAIAHQAAGAGTHGHAGHGHAHEPAYLSTSLTLCLALALVLAAANGLQARRLTASGWSLWLFGAVPLLGFLAGSLIESGSSPAAAGSAIVELLPVAALVLVVQVSLAFTAVRLARGLLDLVADALQAPAGPVSALAPEAAAHLLHLDVARMGATAPARAGGSRAPPASFPAV